ncbi:MAG: hypothetical protein V4547_10450 [Bacteroidota bacterium]
MYPDKIIKQILEIINPIMDKNKAKDFDFPSEFTFFHVLERIKFNLESLDLLVGSDMIKYEHGIGLICRNLLSDFITIGFIVKLSKDEEEYYVNLYRLYYTDLSKAESFLNMYLKAEIVTEQDLIIFRNKKKNPEEIHKLIFDYAAEYNINKFPSNAGIIELFIQSKLNDQWISEVINSYDIWTFYSKYEHIGWSSYNFTRNTEKTKAVQRLLSVLKKTTLLLSTCLDKLGETESLIKSNELHEVIYKA